VTYVLYLYIAPPTHTLTDSMTGTVVPTTLAWTQTFVLEKGLGGG
jgi:hypothetical protein